MLIAIHLGVLGFIALCAYLLRRDRVTDGAARIARMNAGTVCFNCDSPRIRRTDEGLWCGTCGAHTPRAWIEGGGHIDAALLEEMTVDPRDELPWYMR